MQATKKTVKNIDAYLLTQPAPVKLLLETMRQTIRQAAPQAEEVISYQMPAYKYHGMLVYFAGFKNHIGFYPTTSAINAFKKELAAYAGAKGTVRFPLDEPLPLKLVERIVQFRVKENAAKAKLRGAGKPKAAK